MDVILGIKRILRKHEGIFEVYDTSAAINYPNKLKETVEQDNNIIVVMPEGTVHELSLIRHRIENARIAYEYIKRTQSNKLIKEVAADSTRAWTIDEQVIDIVYKYHKKGRVVRLVTCDQDQAYKAGLKKLTCVLLPGSRTTQTVRQLKETTPKNAFGTKSQLTSKQPQNITSEIKDEINVPYKKIGKENYIDVNTRIAVYDNKGKRKIGKAELIKVLITDSFVYKNQNYRIIKIEDSILTLKRVGST